MWKIGHRGACGYEPENTLASFRKAIDLGVHGFEFDIQLSKEGEPVVIHDDTVDRTTECKGKVSDFSTKELQAMNAGNGEKIPTLRNVFDLVDKRCRLFIELKAPRCTPSVVEMITDYVTTGGWNYEQIYVCSFDHMQLVTTRQINSEVRTCALMVGIPVSLAAVATEASAWAINPNIHHMNKKLIDDAKQRNLKIITWTANDPLHIEAAKKLGVDGIISDFPDRL